MKIFQVNDLFFVRFFARQLGIYVDPVPNKPNLARPHTAAEVLRLCPEAEVVLNGPMFHVADGAPSYQTYKVGHLDYRHIDTEDGDAHDGGTKTDRKGLTLSVVAPGEVRWSSGDSPAPGALVAVQGYPSLIERGVNTADPALNKGAVWRSGIGSVGTDELVFAVSHCSMSEFAERLIGFGCNWALYTDGGGSSRLAAREKGVKSRGSEENRPVPSWLTVEIGR